MFAFVCCCGEKAPIEIWQTSSGKEYKILKIGILHSSKYGKMFTVRFKSQNVNNPELLGQEFRDIYILVAQKINLTGFTHVGLEAVPKNDPHFGCQKIIGYRNNKSVEDVKKLIGEVKNQMP